MGVKFDPLLGKLRTTDVASGGSATWGNIVGTLSDQTDLQSALDAKENSADLATVATTGAYTDLTGKPTLGTLAALNSVDLTANVGSTVLPIANGGTGSATQNFVDLSTSQTKTGALVLSTASATALTVGPNGTTNPVLQVDASTASQATGVSIKGAAAGSPPIIAATSSATNENISIFAKGTGNIVLGSGSVQSTFITGTFRPGVTSAGGNVNPLNTNTYGLGTSSLYWQSGFVITQNFNSTASMTGPTAGTINVNAGSLGILATSNAATHSLTLGSTATGIALYNTSDQTTNYERIVGVWSGNVFTLATQNGGTGTARNFAIGTPSAKFTVRETPSSTGTYLFDRSTNSANAVGANFTGTWTQASGVNPILQINPTINQSSTAGYTALLVNPTETATGSGAKLLADFQVGGTSKFNVSNTGHVMVEGVTSTGATGTGNIVFGTSPTLTTPALGIPSALTLTNATGLPVGGISATGTPSSSTYLRGDGTWATPGGGGTVTSVSVVSANGFAGSVATATSTPAITISTSITGMLKGDGTSISAATADVDYTTPTGTETFTNKSYDTAGTGNIFKINGTTVSAVTGSGSVVLGTGPSLSAPAITGAATANSLSFNNNAVTVTSNAGTCSAGFRFSTFTNSSAATMAITISTSGAIDGQAMIVRIYDFSAVAQTIGWTNTENSTVSAPTTSNGSTTLPLTVGFMYNVATSKWRCVAVS